MKLEKKVTLQGILGIEVMVGIFFPNKVWALDSELTASLTYLNSFLIFYGAIILATVVLFPEAEDDEKW